MTSVLDKHKPLRRADDETYHTTQLSEPSDNLGFSSEFSSTSCGTSGEFGYRREDSSATTDSISFKDPDIVFPEAIDQRDKGSATECPDSWLLIRQYDYSAEEKYMSGSSGIALEASVHMEDLETTKDIKFLEYAGNLECAEDIEFTGELKCTKDLRPPCNADSKTGEVTCTISISTTNPSTITQHLRYKVSLWLFMTESNPKPRYSELCREVVVTSQAGKLIDPVHYQGLEELLRLEGTTLRDDVT
ncbi:hypothetical protein MMC34_002753 [Xylographa carneopallida]|nr:hypothetical protein [Xylographa carneopallida]